MGGATTAVRAILFTDMVGSSALRNTLGDVRADLLRRHHDELIDAVIARHDGVVLRWTGDGVKAEFASASSAVNASVELQRSVTTYGRRADAVTAFQVRIGISIGEVTFEDDDDHGIAVIEAARLEALAAPGEILATDLVQRLGMRRVDAGFEEVGTQVLKGLDQPVNIVRIFDTSSGVGVRPVPKALTLDRRFPLVGRAGEVATAMGRWAEVAGGSARTVLVSGPPGMGKSRFVAQIAEQAHKDGAMVLAGVCDSDLAVPFQPFAAAFGDAVGVDDELRSAFVDGSGPLGALFPTRRVGRQDEPSAAARFELFEAAATLVERLANAQPLVLVLEDLQWATAPTVQMLRHLVRRATDTRLLILGTFRSEEVGAAHPLFDLLAEAHSDARLTKLGLGALDVDDVAELVLARVPTAPPPNVAGLARRIREESAGSPFFVCELLHHLSGTGELDRLVLEGAGERLPIPDSVRDVVGQRLARLADESRSLLPMAAVIGLSFDLQLLADVVDRPPERVLELLEDVARVALLQEADAGRFSFAHSIVRTTLLDSLTATRRALAHRRVAETISTLRPADHDQLAHHWRLAGVADRANTHLELAADRDLEAFAFESAADRYQTLLDYHRTHPGEDAAAQARSFLGLGLAHRALARPEYIDSIQEAGRLARRLRNHDLMADAAVASIWPGNFFITAGRIENALVELGEDALAHLDVADARRPRVLATLAAHLTFDPDRARRVALLAEGLELARRNGDPELIGSVLLAEYVSLWDPFAFERRAEITRELARMARASGDVILEFFAGFFAAFDAAERCDPAEARRRLAALDGPITASRNFYFGFLAERLSVSLDVLTGKADVQRDIDALAARYDGTHADTAGTWSVQTAGVAMQTGSLAPLAPVMRTMVEASDVKPNWMPAYGLALLAIGDRDGAMHVLDTLEPQRFDYFYISTMQSLVDLVTGLGRVDRCPEIFEALLPYRDLLGVVASGSLCFGLVSTSLGDLALAMGDYETAVELLERSVRVADAMGAPSEAVKARRLLVTAQRAQGRPAEAVAGMLSDALDSARRGGFLREEQLLLGLRGHAEEPSAEDNRILS